MRINGKSWTAQCIAARIDHTVLAPDTQQAQIESACALARAYGFKAVFTMPYWSPLVADLLDGSGIAAGISAAFPSGAISTKAKVAEVMDSVDRLQGKPCAVDMVTNIALLKDKQFAQYSNDMAAVVRALEGRGIIVKAIIETALLNADEIHAACSCAAEAGVDFAKTSTGKAGPPALSHIGLMRQALPPHIGIKFSGFGTLNSPELAFWAFSLGADLVGSPCGNVIVDALAAEYNDTDIIHPGMHANKGTAAH